MEENFEPVARTRANYYTPGSPVQFVCVELLRGEQSGEHAVCLTFKNISRVVLTALEVHFKCKGVDGVILCEDEFEYCDLEVQPGESFGMDDAVFVTPKAITSVDVSLKSVYNGKRVVHLDQIKRMRLPAPKRLESDLQSALEARMNRKGMKYLPQVLDNGGWYCACGAFHPKEEDTVYCSECGCDRILLQNALNSLLQPAAPAQEPSPSVPEAEEPTRVAPRPAAQPEEEATRIMPPYGQQAEPVHAEPEQDMTRVLDAREMFEPAPQQQAPARPAQAPRYASRVQEPEQDYEGYEDDEDYEDYDSRDSIAEHLIRWVPPITAIVCAGIALWGFVYYQFFL